MYDTYLFDLYGTLVDIHTDEEKMELWEKLSYFYGYYGAIYKPEELQERYLFEVDEMKKEMQERKTSLEYKQDDSHEANPDIELEYVFQRLFKHKGIEADLSLSIHAGQVFRAVSTEYICLYEGAKELIEDLKKAGKKVYLLSNAQKIFTYYELRYLGIDRVFDDIFISSEYGCKKPDQNFYMKPIKKYHIDTKQAVMIGNDYLCDIIGAQKVGLNTFYIHSNLSPKSDLDYKINSTYYLLGTDLAKVKEMLLTK